MKYYLVRVSNGERKIYTFRKKFNQEDYKYFKKRYGKSYYEKKITEKSELKSVKDYCKENGLECTVIDSNFIRSTTYRDNFFDNVEPIIGNRYFCAYCGKLIPKEKVSVDHIYPIDKVQESTKLQKELKKKGITNVNDVKNLVASCKSCNSKKHTQMGDYIKRGTLGKNQYIWEIRWLLRFMVAIGVPVMIIIWIL